MSKTAENKNNGKVINQPTVIRKNDAAVSEQQWQERLQNLINGRATPHNDVAKYMTDQLRKIVMEIKQATETFQQHRNAAAQAEKQLVQLQGQQTKYIEDLKHWDKPSASEKTASLPSAAAEQKAAH